ncbi:MAG: aromatic acid exporter family protein [Microbacteriaceae bacterium]
MTVLGTLRTSARTPVLQVLKTAVAVVISWIVCELAFEQPPVFAAIASLLVVQPSVNQTLAKGLERSVGVVLGVAVAFAIGLLVGTGSAAVLAVVLASIALAWLLRLSAGSSAQIPISAMLVLAIGALTPAYALERVVETVIGAAIGLIVNVAIVPPVHIGPAHAAVLRLGAELADRIDALALTLSSPQSPAALNLLLDTARATRAARDRTRLELDRARESLAYTPRAGRRRAALETDAALYARLSNAVTRVVGMTRTVHDRWHPGVVHDPVVQAIAEDLRRAAHDLRLLVLREQGSAEGREPPALTAPLVVGAPDRGDWVLVGSLLEDLRRVRDEIIGVDEG